MNANERPYWSRVRQRVSRRRLLLSAAVGGAGVAGATLVGCGDDDDDDDEDTANGSPTSGGSPAAAQGEPKAGGTLRVARMGTPPHFDPSQNASFEVAGTHGLTMNRLVRPESGPQSELGSLRIVNDLAESWEQVDEVTYVFKVRPNATFHDKPPVSGRAVNSEDVKYTFERLLDPNTAAPHRSQHEQIDRMEPVDATTIRITSKEPFSPFINSFAYPYSGWIIAREAVEAFGDLKSEIIGTGPFVFESYQPNVQSTYLRNPSFFDAPLPYLDRVEWQYVTDYQARLAGFLSGEYAIGSPTAVDLEAAEAAANDSGGGIHRLDSITTVALIPMTRKAPFNDARVRKAIQRAIDMQQIIDVVYFGEGKLAGLGVPPAMTEWSISQEEIADLFRYDPEEAKQLLADAGYADGFTASIYNVPTAYGPTFVDITEIVAEQLRQVGITINIEAKEYATHLQTWVGENFDMYLGPRGIGFDPYAYLYGEFYPGADRNYSKTDDDELNAMLERFKTTFDQEELRSLARDIQHRLAEIMAEIPMPLPVTFVAYHGQVKDYVPNQDYGTAAATYMWLDE